MLKRYRVNGRDDYAIEFVEPSSSPFYRLFAREHPADPYGKSVSECHLYSTDEICVAAGHEPKTLDRAKAIAVHWMEGWSQYVRTGEFPKGSRRVSV